MVKIEAPEGSIVNPRAPAPTGGRGTTCQRLADLCRREPTTFEELLEVTGIGERKAESFGADVLRALQEFQRR